ncbi:hypothetical protein [Domibacillus antri]|uniref:hypothetical protein n=1 Tax=Domibacillus antri TaxID=1714264 RepID=UPI0011773D1C|nr:hypothetical protein [Domibacillus antri]
MYFDSVNGVVGLSGTHVDYILTALELEDLDRSQVTRSYESIGLSVTITKSYHKQLLDRLFPLHGPVLERLKLAAKPSETVEQLSLFGGD